MSQIGRIGKYHTWFRVSSTLCISFLLLIFCLQRVPIRSGDTQALAESASSLVKCIHERQWAGCAGSTQFGIVQYLPAMLLAWRGMTVDGIVLVLSFLNVASFFFMLRMAWSFPLKNFESRLLLILMLLSSPLVAYAPFSFGESLVCCLAVATAFFLFQNSPGMFSLSFSLLLASKETAAISVIPIVIAAQLLVPRENRIRLRRLVLSSFAGLAVVIGFNYFKFGTWTNAIHADPSLRTNNVSRSLGIVLGLVASPNGGVAFFWPSACVILVLVSWMTLHKEKLGADRRPLGALALIFVGLIGQLAGLGNWYAPFGWVAYGPRLMMPTMTLAVVAVVFVYDSVLTRNPDSARLANSSVSRFTLLGIVGAAGLSAAVGFVNDPLQTLSWFNRTDSTCPRPAVIQLDRDYYFRCLFHGMWSWRDSMFERSIQSFRESPVHSSSECSSLLPGNLSKPLTAEYRSAKLRATSRTRKIVNPSVNVRTKSFRKALTRSRLTNLGRYSNAAMSIRNRLVVTRDESNPVPITRWSQDGESW